MRTLPLWDKILRTIGCVLIMAMLIGGCITLFIAGETLWLTIPLAIVGAWISLICVKQIKVLWTH